VPNVDASQPRVLAVALATATVLASCRSHEQPRPTVVVLPPAGSVAEACASRKVLLQPRTDTRYRARVEERGQIYESHVAFTKSPDGWGALETDFTLQGDVPNKSATDAKLAGGELHSNFDVNGKPRRFDESLACRCSTNYQTRAGSCSCVKADESLLSSVSLFAFRVVVISPDATACPGNSWDAHWQREARDYNYHYRVESVRDGAARIATTGRVTTSVNHWDIEGYVDLALADGFSGESVFHVRGPGAPAVNEFDRRVSVAPELP
jgi:hypothetical protein